MDSLDVFKDGELIVINSTKKVSYSIFKNRLKKVLTETEIKIIENIINDKEEFNTQTIVADIKNNFICQIVKSQYIFAKLNDISFYLDFNTNEYIFKIGEKEYNSKELTADDKSVIYDKMMNLFDCLENNKYLNKNTTDVSLLSYRVNLVNLNKVKVITEDDTIMLCLPCFYKEKCDWMNLVIAKKDTKEICGSIEFCLNKDNNFSYNGNINYKIKEPYRNKGYAKKALGLLRNYINENALEYNKTLFISITNGDISAEKVAINNGAVLYYDGNVPTNDPLYIYSKVDHVKVYKI